MSVTDPGQSESLTEIVVPSRIEATKEPEQRILAEVERHGYSPDAAFAIKLALQEAVTNAIKHGNRNDPSKHLTLRFAVSPEKTVIAVADEGEGFCVAQVPDPTIDANLECPTGRGIMLMRAYMNHVSYNDTGTEVTMVKLNE
ncbi:MAG TPA: ATP-binding protein [Phycisphaerae bacterium]|nr:ATP-binding protein [Phycisphaerae bacterium]